MLDPIPSKRFPPQLFWILVQYSFHYSILSDPIIFVSKRLSTTHLSIHQSVNKHLYWALSNGQWDNSVKKETFYMVMMTVLISHSSWTFNMSHGGTNDQRFVYLRVFSLIPILWIVHVLHLSSSWVLLYGAFGYFFLHSSFKLIFQEPMEESRSPTVWW